MSSLADDRQQHGQVKHSTDKRTCSIWSKINSQNDCWWSEHEPGNRSFDTEWRTGDEKICAKLAPRNLTEQERVERSFWHSNTLRWGCSLLTHLISHLATYFYFKSKISSERTPFWVNRRHPEGCNAGLKWRPTKCFPGMLQRMAALLEKVCAGTRDALWRWIHRSWWINKIKIFLEPVSLLYCCTSYYHHICYR